MKTYSMKAGEIVKNWLVIDAEDLILGRLAAKVADILRGKHKPEYTPHMNCGDNVIIINADKIHLTGRKFARHTHMGGRTFYWHTGYPGGIKSITSKQMMDKGYADRVVKLAVKRMLPKNKLALTQIKSLFVYSGNEHPHHAQKPVTLDFKAINEKNS